MDIVTSILGGNLQQGGRSGQGSPVDLATGIVSGSGATSLVNSVSTAGATSLLNSATGLVSGTSASSLLSSATGLASVPGLLGTAQSIVGAPTALLSGGGSSSASSTGDSYTSSGDSDSDEDLKPFNGLETGENPCACCFGGNSAADKAKPEMQQNLREVKAIGAALSQMADSDSEADPALSSSVAQVREKEQIIRSCLKRGKGAANESYKAQGVDPNDMNAVSSFVARIGREVMDIGLQRGLDISVSQKRADRLQEGGGKTGQGGGGGTGDADGFEITSEKTEKQVQLGVDEVEANPVLREAIFEQLTGMWSRKQKSGDAFQAPATLDLGETRANSPLDRALGSPGGHGQASDARGAGPDRAVASTEPAARHAEQPALAQPAPSGSGRPDGEQPVAAPTSIGSLMRELGMTGAKFNAKVQVYEPGQMVQLAGKGAGGVKVDGSLKGKAIAVKTPRMVARDQDGKMHQVSGLHRAGGGGYVAKIRGDAGGAAQAARPIQTEGNGSIAIPGVMGA